MTLLRGHRHIEIESQDDAAETSDANEQDEVFSTPRTRGARMLILPIVAYRRWISPALPARCRFYPSCSAYALEAISTHGVFKGLGLATWRLLRCQPFHPGGYDPVPPRKN